MAAYVFNLDNRVVDQHADHQCQRQQRDSVQGVAEVLQAQKGWNHRQRQRGRGDQSSAPVAQKPPDHQHRQQRALVEQRHRAFKVFLYRLGVVDDLPEQDVRVRSLQLCDSLARSFRHLQLTRAPGPENFKTHDFLAILCGHRSGFGHAVQNQRDLVQANAPAIAERQFQPRQFCRCPDGGDGAHRLLGPADITASAGCLLLHQAQLARHLNRADVKGCHFDGIQLNAHLAADAAYALDGTQTGHAEQPFGHGIVDKPAQILIVYPGQTAVRGQGRRSHKSQYHAAGRRGLGDRRVAQLAGQVGAHACDGIAHIIDRLSQWLFKNELDADLDRAVQHAGVNVLHALQ